MPARHSTVIQNCSDPVSEERVVSLCGAGPDLRLLATLALVRDNCLSTGKAAELTGRSKAEFFNAMNQFRLPYFSETPTELRRQVEDVRKLLRAGES